MKEQWKDVVDYEGLYQVSNLGNVRSLDRYVYQRGGSVQLKKGRMLKHFDNHEGYYIVRLLGNGSKAFSVHRLVAQAFISNEKNLPCVNHKDQDKHNNIVSNLEWCDVHYNNTYGDRVERMRKNQLNKHSKVVIQYDENYNEIARYPSAREASRITGIHFIGIGYCCRGHKKHPRAGGYIWKYSE